ncbi:MAG: acetyltransferase [Bacteroidota bacterium]
MRDLILFGGGGHARSVIDVVESGNNYRIQGIIDSKERVGDVVLNYSIIGSDDNIAKWIQPERDFLITVGQISSAEVRIRLDKHLSEANGRLATLISPSAKVSSYASVAEGTVVMHFAMVNAGANVGRNAIINTRATVEHDVSVGDFSHISTGAILNGGVKVGKEVFVGSHATVQQGIVIADRVVVGAHSYVHRDITEAGVYVGVPARRLQ